MTSCANEKQSREVWLMFSTNQNLHVEKNTLLASHTLTEVIDPVLADMLIEHSGGFASASNPIPIIDDVNDDFTADLVKCSIVDFYVQHKTLMLDFIDTCNRKEGTSIAEYIYSCMPVLGDEAMDGVDAVAYALYQPAYALKLRNEAWVNTAKIAMHTAYHLAMKAMATAHNALQDSVTEEYGSEANIHVNDFLKSLEFDDEKIQKHHELPPLISSELAHYVIEQLGGSLKFTELYAELKDSGLENNVQGFSTEAERDDFFVEKNYLIGRFIILLNSNTGESVSKLHSVRTVIMKRSMTVDEVAKSLYSTERTKERAEVIFEILNKIVKYLSLYFDKHIKISSRKEKLESSD